MDDMDISTEPAFLEVELPPELLNSSSTSTFLPDEEASICPLLCSNSALEPTTLSHPLSPNIVTCDITSSNLCDANCKAETSSSGSSTGIVMDALDTTSTNLFNKVNYHHLQNNNVSSQESNGHYLKGCRRNSKDTPNFVSWNWPVIRKCTLFVFLSIILAMCSIVVTKIASMPKHCNPKSAWFRGGVFYEVDPASFKDSDNNGIGDINGIINDVEYFSNLGVSGVRLNSIFPHVHQNGIHINGTSLETIRPELGNLSSVRNLANVLHSHNISLLLDLPVQHMFAGRTESEVSDVISESLQHWINQGVDGFYIKGLGSLTHDVDLLRCLSSWKIILGPSRVLMLEESIIKGIPKPKQSQLLEHIDLVDVNLNIENDSQQIIEHLKNVLLEIPNSIDSTWVHWSIGLNNSVIQNKALGKMFAAIIMQLILPGTPNILHSNQIAIAQNKIKTKIDDSPQNIVKEFYNLTSKLTNNTSTNELKMVQRMIALREQSPTIYKNVIHKANNIQSNTQIIPNKNRDIVIIVRTYPRKNSFVSVTNFGSRNITLDLNSKFYSGEKMLIDESREKFYFKDFKVHAFDTIVVKLDK